MESCILQDPRLLPTVFTNNQLCLGTQIKGLFLFQWELDALNDLRVYNVLPAKLHGNATVMMAMVHSSIH